MRGLAQRSWLLLAIALSGIVGTTAYLKTNAGETYLCDGPGIDALSLGGEETETCKEYCKR